MAKRVGLLDQMRNGLKLYGLLDAMMEAPDLFEHFFVANATFINGEIVFTKLEFENDVEYSQSHEYFTEFVKSIENKMANDFFIFCTGCKFLPRKMIQVKYGNFNGITTSTCLFQLSLPNSFQSKQHFQEVMEIALLSRSLKSFTTI